MGGDGGVIASNRKYLRGAGNANHTADHNREKKRAGFVVDKEAAQECMTTCAVTAKPLDFTRAIVICPYGRLYQREAALEALLRRKQQEQQQQQELQHIRGLKDFHVAQFETKRSSSSISSSSSILPVCPLTGEELNGQSAAFFIIRSPTSSKNSTTTCTSEQQSNVLSERAIKEMGMESLQTELGPFDEDEMIRLAPPAGMMDTIRDKLAEKQKKEKQFHKVRTRTVRVCVRLRVRIPSDEPMHPLLQFTQHSFP